MEDGSQAEEEEDNDDRDRGRGRSPNDDHRGCRRRGVPRGDGVGGIIA